MSQKASIQGQRHILACVDSTDDLHTLQGVLTSQSANAAIYHDISELCIHISDQTDAVLISGDMVTTESYELLAQTLDRQPDWSDLPIIFSVPGGPSFPKAGDATRDLGNLFLLQHPLESADLKNALHLALRGRDRQRRIRDLSKECEHSTRSLKEARKQLDRKIRERTDELVEAIPRSEKLLSGMIRLLIVDDHAVMRQGLSTSLGQEPDIAIIGEAIDGKTAIEKARGLHPDVILMDLGMPRMSGIEATKVIHTEMPRVRVIGLSMFEEKEQANAMFEAGAVAYLSKGCSVDALTSTIRRCVGKPELPAGHI